jgi:hypothetical protein
VSARTWLRLGLVAASATLAALAAVWAWPRLRGEPELLRFHQLGDEELEPADARPGKKRLSAATPQEWRYFLSEPQTKRLLGDRMVYDPWTYVRSQPFQDVVNSWPEHPEGRWRLRTNGEGLREDHELGTADLRVLVAGDSHTFGICSNAESFPNLLEARLAARHPGKSVEVFNAGDAGFSFYNYFGTLLRFQAFAPQVFVVAVYAGNDFVEVTHLHHRFHRTPSVERPPGFQKTRARALEVAKHALGQCFSSVFSLARLPGEYEKARGAALELCTEMKQVCDERGIALLVCLIPPACDGARAEPHAEMARAISVLGLAPEELNISARLAADFLQDLAGAGIATLDMSPIFAAQTEPPFWDLDLHMDLAGHRLVAEALEPVVEARLPQ